MLAAANRVIMAEKQQAIQVWSHNWVALTTLLLSVTGGAPLALINWWRMGYRRKFWIHLPLAVMLIVYLIALQPLIPELVRYASDTVITLVATAYLWWQTRRDVASLKSQSVAVVPENWIFGIVLSIVTLLIAFALLKIVPSLLHLAPPGF
jgi:hypothetical protein